MSVQLSGNVKGLNMAAEKRKDIKNVKLNGSKNGDWIYWWENL